MQNRRTFIYLALVALLMLGLVSPLSAQDAKSITVSWPQEPDSLNPMYTTMTFAGYTYQLYLAPAWTYDQDYSPVPVLVSELPSQENGGISEDGTTFTLTLNEGMTWSDGDPLDSADFVFTYEMVMSEANTPLGRAPYDRIASVEAPDALTVVVSFDAPYAPWLGLFAYVLPEHVLRPVFEADGTLDNAAFNRAPSVASGPYVFQEWETGSFMRFTPNASFVGGEPIIDVVVVNFIPDDAAYVASLSAGDSDLGTFFPFSDVPGLRDAGLTVELLPSGYNEGWFFNVGPDAHPAMQDVRVREAVALGFDRFSFNEDLNEGVTYPATSWWEGTPYQSPNLSPIPYDPARAAELLDEAGWVDSNGNGIRDQDGVELELRFIATTRGIRQDMQAVAQQQLAEIGVGIIIENFASNIFFNSYADGGPAATGQYDIATWSSSPANFPDPDTSRWTCAEIPTPDSPTGNNWNFYCDPAIDELLLLQTQTTDPAERAEIFHQIDELIYNAYIWAGVWFDADTWAVSSRVLNTALNGQTPFWNVAEWDVAD